MKMPARCYVLSVLLCIGCSSSRSLDPVSSAAAADSQPSSIVWCTPGSTCDQATTGALPQTASLVGTTTDGACTVTVDIAPREVQGTPCNPGILTIQDMANRDSDAPWLVAGEATVTCADGVSRTSVFHPTTCDLYDKDTFAALTYHAGRVELDFANLDYLDVYGTPAGIHVSTGRLEIGGTPLSVDHLAFAAAP
jgi:hypothetical protein